jgi:phage shock protein A
MGLFKRISDIISANFNEMVEDFENPELMLKQAIREMEQSINEVTEQTAKAMANEKTIQRELERNRAQAETWQTRAEKSLADGDEELARKSLSRRREHEKLVAALQDQRQSAQEAAGTLRRQLDAMKAKLAEAKRSHATLVARQRAAEFRKRTSTESAGISTDVDANAFAKFDRLRAKVEQAEAEAEALSELRRGEGSPSQPDEQFCNEDLDVDAELAELKRKLKDGGK